MGIRGDVWKENMISIYHGRKPINWSNRVIAGVILAFFLIPLSIFLLQTKRSLVLKQAHLDLKWIGLALHQYHDEHGMFPLPVRLNSNGTAKHSWRALVLDEMEQADPSLNFLSKYDFAQPWNSEANLAASTSHPFNRNPYQFFAVVGDDAAWSQNQSRSIKDIADGTSNTAFVLGLPSKDVNWSEPVDIKLMKSEHLLLRDRELNLSKDLFVLRFDGSVSYYENGLASDKQNGIFTISGGENISP